MASETLTVTVKNSGEVLVDVETGDNKCRGITQKLLQSMRELGIENTPCNVDSRYPDDGGTKVKINC